MAAGETQGALSPFLPITRITSVWLTAKFLLVPADYGLVQESGDLGAAQRARLPVDGVKPRIVAGGHANIVC